MKAGLCCFGFIPLVLAIGACRQHDQPPSDKELDVQLAQAKARQAEAEAEKAALEARASQQAQPASNSSPRMQMFSRSKVDVAQLNVKKYAFEAFGEWSQAHPDKACPDKLEDLNAYMDSKDVTDPWGHPYRMYCGQALPAGAKGGLAVLSAGEDGREGTEDAIKSW